MAIGFNVIFHGILVTFFDRGNGRSFTKNRHTCAQVSIILQMKSQTCIVHSSV